MLIPGTDKMLTGTTAPPVHPPALISCSPLAPPCGCFVSVWECVRESHVLCVDIRIDGLTVGTFNAR